MSESLSVVIPVYNEAEHLPATIAALVDAIDRSAFDAELIVVDDGSTDGTASVVAEACAGRVPLRVLKQPNRGRLEARRAGVEASDRNLVLLIDSRVRLDVDGLAFVAERVKNGDRIWNGHVEVVADRNPYAVFWKLLAELAWADYFADPRTTRFDASNFDRFPKGTGCFLVPRGLLLDAMRAFRSRYARSRDANDDTPLLRWIAGREPINISPEFSCVYAPRTRFRAFLRHAFRRGIVFVDGHGRRESRFYWAAIGFYPASALLMLAAVRRPLIVPAGLAAVGVVSGAIAAKQRRSPFEIFALAAVTPVYAVGHGAGMWRALVMLVRQRVTVTPTT
jgi:glycosyltransferase involved in cell wall biosynthesis